MLIARYTARFRLIAPLAGTRIRARNSAILRVMAQLRGLPRNTAAQARVSRNLAHLSTRVFLRKSDCLGCAVLLCLIVCLTLFASFFLPSHLSLKHVHTHEPAACATCAIHEDVLLTLGAHAQQGLQYLVCVSVCLSVHNYSQTTDYGAAYE